MYFQKRQYFVLRISLLAIFLFVTMKSTVFALISTINNGNELRSEDVIEITGKSSCGLMGDSCCCDISVANNNDCCCNSSTLGKGSIDLVAETSDNKFFNTFFSNIGCSNNSDDFQNHSISDYETSKRMFLSIFENIDFQKFLQDNHIDEPHLFLPFKPPKNIA